MARLPTSLPMDAPRGERPSTDTVAPTNFGLDKVAEVAVQYAKVSREQDEAQATELLKPHAAIFERDFAGRAETEAANGPAFAAQEMARVSDHFMGLAESVQSQGVREAMLRKIDQYRGAVGDRAIEVQTRRRAGVVAAQERAREDMSLAPVRQAFQAEWRTRQKALIDAYDGSQGDFANSNLSAWGEAQSRIEGSDAFRALAPEVQARLQSELAAQKTQAFGEALVVEDKGRTAFLVQGARSQADAVINNILSHPQAFDTARVDLARALSPLPTAVQGELLRGYHAQAAEAKITGLLDGGETRTASQLLESGSLDSILDPKQKAALIGKVRSEAAHKANGLMRAMELGEEVDPAAMLDAAEVSGDPGVSAEANFRAIVGANEARLLSGTGAKIGGGFREAADFTIALEGGDVTIPNDNGRGASQFGINQAANPDLPVGQLTRTQAVARYRKYWQAVGGDQLPPAMANVAFDAAVLFGPDDAKRWLHDSDGNVGRFLHLERAAMRALAAKDPAKYGDDLKGWLNRVDKMEQRAGAIMAFANTEEGVSGDPIKFALSKLKTTVPPLPELGADQSSWTSALSGRLKIGQTMNRDWRAPMRLLTDGEAAYLKDQVEADPQAGVRLAEVAQSALGYQAAKRMLGEVGLQGQASVHLHIADLSTGWSRGFARQAAQGLVLQKDKQALPKAESDEIAAVMKRLTPALPGAPEWVQAVQQTAEAAALMQSRTGGPKSAVYNVHAALGRTQKAGQFYGGVVQLNGAPVIIPQWLGQDHAEDALERLAENWVTTGRGPVWSNGKPMPADAVAKAQLQIRPDGRYRLVDRRGVALMAPGGRPYEFDLDAAQPFLRRTIGAGAVLGEQ